MSQAPDRTPLRREIADRIANQGPIPFRDFFALALYHPEHGYYMRPSAATGREGDFSTSSDVSPAFGQRLAVAAADVFERLGSERWSLVEIGPGRGLLMADMLDGLARHAPRALQSLAEVVLVEVSPSLREAQERRLADHPSAPPRRWVASLDELEPGSITGCVIANEVLDALPVHAVVRRGDRLAEIHVDLAEAPGDDGEPRFRLVEREPGEPRLVALAERYGLCPREGHQAEICLELESWIQTLDRALARGAAVLVDYGHEAATLADEHHADGTLLAYHRHRVETDLLARPGEQDLTAHVNWTHLEDAARAAGFTWAGRTTQDRFLLALGIVEDMAADPAGGAESASRTAFRLSARSLVMPGTGGGRRFEACCLVKGVPADLRGLQDPFA